MIISDNRGEGKRGGTFANEMITDGVKMTATMEWGMLRVSKNWVL